MLDTAFGICSALKNSLCIADGEPRRVSGIRDNNRGEPLV